MDALEPNSEAPAEPAREARAEGPQSALPTPRTGVADGASPGELLGALQPAADLRAELQPGAQLAGRDLSDLDLSGLDLTGADLSGADLTGAILVRARLCGARLDRAVLEDAELLGADLSEASMEQATLSRAGLGGARLDGARLFGAELGGASLTDASLVDADLRTAKLHDARLANADLRGALFERAVLLGADLSEARVDRACLDGADLRGARLAGVSGYGSASWLRCDLREADFSAARLVERFVRDQNYLDEFRTQGRIAHVAHFVWWLTSDCGRSIARWGLTTLVVAVAFALLYTTVAVDYGAHATALSPFYFSLVTLTTLGYGDVLPASVAAQVVAMFEVVIGYMLLGGMLSIFGNRMARRAD